MARRGGSGPLLVLERPHPGTGDRLWIRARCELGRLRPRQPASERHAPHPGTVVRVDEELLEVVAVEAAAGDYPWLYRLQPLDPRATMRTALDLSPQGLLAYETALRAERESERRGARIGRAAPLVGLLPAHRQAAIRHRTGLDPERLTRASALVLLLLTGPFALFAGMAGIANAVAGARTLPGMPTGLALLLAYLTIESAFRLAHQAPIGSLPVAIAVAVLEETGLLARTPDGVRRRRAEGARERQAEDLIDRLERLPGRGGGAPHLRIEAPAPKNWATGARIFHEGRNWQLLAAGEAVRDGRPIWTYELEQRPIEETFVHAIPYRPDEAAEARRQELERSFRERLHVLKPLAGCLPGAMQERWRERHGFDARGATLMSAAIELAIGGLNAFTSLVNLLLLPGRGLGEALVGGFAVLLALEGALRLKAALAHGLPSGTFLLAWVPAWLERRAARAVS